MHWGLRYNNSYIVKILGHFRKKRVAQKRGSHPLAQRITGLQIFISARLQMTLEKSLGDLKRPPAGYGVGKYNTYIGILLDRIRKKAGGPFRS
jgi:hypothetical protein